MFLDEGGIVRELFLQISNHCLGNLDFLKEMERNSQGLRFCASGSEWEGITNYRDQDLLSLHWKSLSPSGSLIFICLCFIPFGHDQIQVPFVVILPYTDGRVCIIFLCQISSLLQLVFATEQVGRGMPEYSQRTNLSDKHSTFPTSLTIWLDPALQVTESSCQRTLIQLCVSQL